MIFDLKTIKLLENLLLLPGFELLILTRRLSGYFKQVLCFIFTLNGLFNLPQLRDKFFISLCSLNEIFILALNFLQRFAYFRCNLFPLYTLFNHLFQKVDVVLAPHVAIGGDHVYVAFSDLNIGPFLALSLEKLGYFVVVEPKNLDANFDL